VVQGGGGPVFSSRASESFHLRSGKTTAVRIKVPLDLAFTGPAFALVHIVLI